MHIVITGANGFVGQALAKRIQTLTELDGKTITRLTLMDLTLDASSYSDPRIHCLTGDLADEQWLGSVLDGESIDMIFHLASVPGGMAERNYTLARAVNIDATQALLERCKMQVESGGKPPVFVFASSIAVFGNLSSLVTDATLLDPQTTYGAQKVIGEVLVSDFSRRGWIDGRSLRLPGVLARPPAPTGQLSAFLSDIIRELAAGRPFVCPTGPEATTWATSLPVVVDDLLHGAIFDVERNANRRCVTLPTLQFSMAELVDAIAEAYKTDARALVRWEPDELIERLFGRVPPIETDSADTAGFPRDVNLRTLVSRSLEPV